MTQRMREQIEQLHMTGDIEAMEHKYKGAWLGYHEFQYSEQINAISNRWHLLSETQSQQQYLSQTLKSDAKPKN